MFFTSKLLEYYSNELNFLKNFGAKFSKKFPDIAKRLGFIDGKSEDPHVERLIESFALLTAQLQQMMDEDFPELSQAILETLMPQFLRPVPSVTVVQFADNPGASARQKVLIIPRHTLLNSRETSENECCFRTCYPLLILPVQLTAAALVAKNFDNDWQLSLTLRSTALSLPADSSLRIYLAGESDFNHLLYEALLSHVDALEYQQHDKKLTYPQSSIMPVGFDTNDYIFSDDLTIDPLHHLVRDYAVFPERFLFIDLPLPAEFFASNNPSPIVVTVSFKNSLTISRLGRSHQQFNMNNIKLNCVPMVNLFTLRAEPIIPDNSVYEYQLNPDIRNPEKYEIYTISKVELNRRQSGINETYNIDPLLGSKLYSHGYSDDDGILWQLKRKTVLLKSGEVDNTFLSFAENGNFALNSHTDIITATLTCINKEGLYHLTTGHPEGDFTSRMDLPGIRICGIMRPRLPVLNRLTNRQQWHLISQLSLNKIQYSGIEGVKILKEVLDIYNIKRAKIFSYLVNLLIDMQVTAITGRLYPDDPQSIARGVSLTMIFHRMAPEQAGFYLFCSIIEKFMGQYAPVNSFIQTSIYIDGEESPHSVWQKRASNLVWL